jgi:hypothetical protein
VSSEKEEITLIVQCDHLSALKFRNRWEGRLEHPAYTVTQAGGKAIQDELGIMGCSSGVPLYSESQLGFNLFRGQD